MARRRQPQERNLRTREHVLADLGVNYVERQVLLRGFAVNRLDTDYGIDLLMLTYSDIGEVENGHVLFQVKATDSLQVLKDGQSVASLAVWDFPSESAQGFPARLPVARLFASGDDVAVEFS